MTLPIIRERLPGEPAPPRMAEVLRARLRRGTGILALPCPYDGLSARLAAQAGYEAMFMGGYALVASRFGFPDIGLATQGEMVEAARVVAASAGVPVLADGDTGHGGSMNVRRTVQSMDAAGVAAVMIEDQLSPKRCGHLAGKQIVDRTEAVLRVRTAVRAAEQSAGRVLILARTDARNIAGLEEAIWRMQAFEAEGAELLFMESPHDEREMAESNQAVSSPTLANVLEGGLSPILPRARLEALGFAMAAYPIALIGAAGHAARAALAAIAAEEAGPPRLSHAELLDATGYTQVEAALRALDEG
ncbi:MAG: isocitrate lyase/PEP mutase family protein [Bosea sp.]|nr:isocitrate lyase/PEP mutase family protein [Bosea sp. (in: a-proteobacteria)]